MKLLSWNIRGIGQSEKRRKIRNIVQERMVDVLFLQETKKVGVSKELVKSIWPYDDLEYMSVDADGFSGGVLCVWKASVFSLAKCCSSRNFLILSGTILPRFNCVFVNVYAPNDVTRRGVVWNALRNLKAKYVDPWCLGRDFNEVRSMGERKGCLRRDKGMREFNEFIEGVELYDVPMQGRQFTWSNSSVRGSWSRIDRILLSSEWLEKFNFTLWGLPRGLSDHCPLLLMEDSRDWGPRPFRFVNAWILHPQFLSVIKFSWVEPEISGWAGFVIQEKLKNLRRVLKSWNHEVFGNVAHLVKAAESELHNLDLLAESRELSNAEVDRRRKLKKEEKKQELVNSVFVGGVLYEDPQRVKSEVFNHFKHVFSEQWRFRPKLVGQFKSVGSDGVAEGLEARFTEEEVWAAVKSCDGNKAHGPDGFNLLCSQKCWKVLKFDVLRFFNEFHENGKLAGGVNSSFVTLIPKVEGPVSISECRPISLIGSMYKILAKVLSNRLRQVISRVIGEAPSAFLEGRNILDGVLIANEVVDWWKRSGIRDQNLTELNPKLGLLMVKDCAGVLNCQNQSLPLAYLGLPLGASPRLKKTWKPVIDKIRAKLASWKRKLLSFGGRLTLIRSVLSSLPVYYLSILKMPHSVIKTIESLRAAFLWGGSELRRKIHLVKWEEITKKRDQGGLGIRRIQDVNDYLLAKWWWRFGVEDKSLWKRVLCSRYQYNGGKWLPFPSSDEYLSKVWGGILRVGQSNSQLKSIFLDNIKLVVGNGGRIQVWLDHWCGNQCLMEKFPRLFSLSTEKDITLSALLERKRLSGVWNFKFRRVLFAWEAEELERLVTLVNQAELGAGDNEDCLKWLACSSEQFSISSLSKVCADSPSILCTGLLWYNLAPPKVQFLGWLAWKGRLKTTMFLQKIGVLNQSASIDCVLCRNDAETVNHVLLWCPFVWQVWSTVLNWWGIQWAVPGNVEGLLHWWMGFKWRKFEDRIWKVIPLAVMWSTWKLRNEVIFSGKQLCVAEFCELILARVAFWVKAHSKGCSYSVQDIIRRLQQIRYVSLP
ncbi:uncharacterized protein LOC114267521 [Camellia sinensis]|uniref:uncharacterized protein LOC114267521 n=1 Tax=Camellia sinensis TaxID=4442 RepID=UPI001035E682|nr:uncharacterized protein LOC114267521 [Camellia sinensis]